MLRAAAVRRWSSLALVLAACGPATTVSPDSGPGGGAADTGVVSAGPDAGAADGGGPGGCASAFGSALTNGFGRIDGTLLAVVRPGVAGCGVLNGDHLVLQVSMNGAAYRLVVNVVSDGRNGTDTKLRYAKVARPLPAPAWSEGWHAGVALDYPGTLGVHDRDFTPLAMDALVERIAEQATPGQPISVYATSQNRPESAHLIHRNGRSNDGAIVLSPTSSSAAFLLFHFDGQTF